MSKRHEFKWSLYCLRVHLRVEKNYRSVHKKLIKMCEGIPEKENYRKQLMKVLAENDRKIIELTRAIKILNRKI